jgi:3-hydroxyacyl-[acyl-carrier-protein] dehydratase
LREEGASVRGRVTVRDPAAEVREAPAGVPASPAALVAEAEIFFAHVDSNRSAQLFGDHNFVFSGDLKRFLGFARLRSNRPGEKETKGAG